MQRKDRARVIREHVAAAMKEDGAWIQSPDIRCMEVKRPDWSAIMWTPFSPIETGPPVARSYAEALLAAKSEGPLGYGINVWTPGEGKVISFEWDEADTFKIISMKRGAWEHDLFGLPVERLGPELTD